METAKRKPTTTTSPTIPQVSMPTEAANRKVVTKFYGELDAQNASELLEQFGEMLDVTKNYGITLLIEEIL